MATKTTTTTHEGRPLGSKGGRGVCGGQVSDRQERRRTPPGPPAGPRSGGRSPRPSTPETPWGREDVRSVP